MTEWLKNNIAAVFGRKTSDDNLKISKRQKRIFKLLLLVLMLIGFSLTILVQEKNKVQKNGKEPITKPLSKIELPDTGIDTERRWREHFESTIAKQNKDIHERLKAMEEEQAKLVNRASNMVETELSQTHEKLKLAQAELASASLDFKRIAREEEERNGVSKNYRETSVTALEFEKEVEFDRPKSAANYIPEGTYFTGYLLNGIAASTGLNAPEEHSVSVTIRLTGRGNLHPLNKLDISKCIIQASAKGDLSSERAEIRLEKLVCEQDGLYQNSEIAGEVIGPDGLNGIKGRVIWTSSKHLKNAMIGGMISGLISSSKGQESFSLSSGGFLATKKKGFTDMLGQGALQGAINAGEKITDQSLRLADSLSPVLTVDIGVRVNPKIGKGFFVGEIGTHNKIKKARK